MRTVRVLLILLAAGLLLAVPLAAQQFENVPQQKPAAPAAVTGVNFGIIDIQAAMARTQEGKKAVEALQAQFGPRQAELEKLQNDIRDLENQLRTQERTLAVEARLQLQRQIEAKRKALTRAQQDFQDEAQQAQEDHLSAIADKMQRIIDQYAREKNLSVIFNVFQGGPIVFATPAVDITDDVVRLYDQTYPVAAGAATAPPPARPAPSRPQRPN